MPDKKIRVLLAKKKIDVHGRGSKLIAREMRDAGMEVIYFRFGTVEDIVSATIQEDVDVLALSIMTSGHLKIVERLIPILKEKGMNDLMVIIGGIIPEIDFAELKAMGVHGAFKSGLPGQVAIDYINENIGKVGLK
ncbi:MAG: methylmalonyl-CoA mutase [Desulfobacterales bacterium]|nr:methylmalonyl-CoA mutase [Desulfobacteraceae bacterium]MBT7085309.1 methylmalonyl-CoA mutase [Desulfobacterales bacterium]MBT7698237.1 methylmalonyl-CoA mutase [Desulfobacterales bacterium]